MSLYDNPPHRVNIFLPSGYTFDGGGGTKLGWSGTPSQASCPCSINTTGAGINKRQEQNSITVGNSVAFKTSTLTVTLVEGTKLVAVDTGRTFIVVGLRSPNREYGSIPQLTYCTCDEIL